MAKSASKSLNVFIGCPGDMATERDALLASRDHIESVVCPVKFTTWKMSASGVGEAQRVIFANDPVESFNIVVILLWSRLGVPSGLFDPLTKAEMTGTEAEFATAYDLHQSQGGRQPQVLLYHCKRDLPPDVDLDQLGAVRKFFKQTEKGGMRPMLAQDFKTPEELTKIVERDIKTAAGRLRDAVKKPSSLARKPSPKLKAANSGELLHRYFAGLRDQFSIYENLGLPVPERDGREGETDAPIPIRRLFVAPACTEAHFRPEAFDAALREGKNPATPLLPRLAPAKSRTVLLADPGMGKSTLIQWLISTLADDAVPPGAEALRGAIPLPFILRDLVGHLPQAVKGWNWDALVDAFRQWRHRGKGAPLAAPLTADDALFRSILASPGAVFLIDGLDEIGDPQRRTAIRDAIWEGFEKYHDARWLITSRIVGYEQAMVDREPPPVIGNTKRDGYASAQAAAVIAARAVRAGDKFPDSILEKVKALPGITVDPTSFKKDGNDAIFAFNTEDSSGEMQRIWVRAGTNKTEFRKDDPTGMAIRELEKAGEVNFETRDSTEGSRELPAVARARATRLHLAPFDDTQQLAFARNWYVPRLGDAAGTQRADDFIAAVHRNDHTRVISRVPNLLYLLALLFRHRARLPDGRALVYAAISSAYLADIDLGRHLPDSLIVPWKFEEKEDLLALVAMRMQEQRASAPSDIADDVGEILVNRQQLEEWLGSRFGGAGDAEACAELHRFLDHIANRSGLLLPRGEGVFGFAHLSFQEYYAACYLEKEFQRILTEKSQSAGDDIFGTPSAAAKKDEEKMFAEIAALPAWHEPLLFLVEKLRHSAPYTSRILGWIFPQLATEPKIENEDNATAAVKKWMPFTAAQLLAGISLDQEVALDDAQRTKIWRSLWQAHIVAWDVDWNIAPSLIVAGSACHTPVLQAASSLHTEKIHLLNCTAVNDLVPLGGMGSLQKLYLPGCTTLSDLQPLSGLRSLQELSLQDCTAVSDLKPLAGLASLNTLFLIGCTAVSDLKPLSCLASLNTLCLIGCTAVSDLKPLAGLASLNSLDLSGCTVVSDEAVAALKASLPKLKIRR